MIPIPSQHDDPDAAEDAGVAVGAFLLVLFVFKLITVVLIFWHLRSWESGVVLGATFWYWIPPLALFGAGPVVFYYRLRKVRTRREALQRAEWMVPDGQELEDRLRARR
jgi:hypothetical protein